MASCGTQENSDEIIIKKPRGRPRLSEEEKLARHDSYVQALEEYKRNYYHLKLKCDHECGLCGKILPDRVSFNKHQRESKKCEAEQLRRQIQKLNDQISYIIN